MSDSRKRNGWLLPSLLALMLILSGVTLFLLVTVPSLSFGRLPSLTGKRTIVSNTLPLEQKWQFETDGLVQQISTSEEQIYVWHGASVSALENETGIEKWVSPSKNSQGLITAVGDDIVAFIPPLGYPKNMKVLDAATGGLLWDAPLYNPRSLAIGDGRLYVGMPNLSAFDPQSGQIVWSKGKEIPLDRNINVYYDAQRLYVVGYDRAYVLNATNGKILNSFPYERTSYETVADNRLFGVAISQFVSAADIHNGNLIWKKSYQLSGIAPTLIHGTLYVITENRELLALDPNTGEPKWKSQSIKGAFSNVVEFDGLGYVVSSTGQLFGFNPLTGEIVGVLDTGVGMPVDWSGGLMPSLVVLGNTLALSFGDSPVFAFQSKLL